MNYYFFNWLVVIWLLFVLLVKIAVQRGGRSLEVAGKGAWGVPLDNIHGRLMCYASNEY